MWSLYHYLIALRLCVSRQSVKLLSAGLENPVLSLHNNQQDTIEGVQVRRQQGGDVEEEEGVTGLDRAMMRHTGAGEAGGRGMGQRADMGIG